MLDKQQPRDYFSYRIQRNLIGPGADILGLPDAEELLSQLPLQLYYSAILFPEKQAGYLENAENKPSIGKNADALEQIAFDESEAENDGSSDNLSDNSSDELSDNSSDESNENAALNGHLTNNLDVDKTNETNATEQPDREYVAANSYFPTNFGLTFCLAPTVKTVDLTFKAGVYEWLNKAEHLPLKRVRIDRDAYFGLLNEAVFPLSDCLDYIENEGIGYAFFKERPPINYRSLLKQFKETHAEAVQKLDLLASTRLFKRRDLCETYPLSIAPSSTTNFPVFKQNGVVIAQCWIKIVSTERANYVKILLQNIAEKQSPDRFSNGNEDLNQKCLFQIGIEATGATFEPYKEPKGLLAFDGEADFLAYQYRNVRDYGIGHGCAVVGSPVSVATTFLPEVNIPAVSQDFRAENQGLKEIAELRNLSVWSTFSQAEMTKKLSEFVEAYAVWILEQEKTTQTESLDFQSVSEKIIQNQLRNLERLRQNVALIGTNTTVFDCFRLANTAMLLQMVTSRDERFGKTEKHLIDFEVIENPADYDSLAFFERYTEGVSSDYVYRPFQLAFLILNLESMIDPTHIDRLESVDLIWFPTGGGKTEAYLALTAFTIFWRRLRYPKACDGVSVIMRYTLRLLTAQQFERAARLICALEFMRRHKSALPPSVRNYAFGSKPITIGMWVGGATTPNKLDDATAKIEKIEKEIRDLNVAKIESTDKVDGKNPFPMTACPFCGCRLITRNKRGILPSGFSIEHGRFKVVCKNTKCAFGKNTEGGIPLDVVDESLYKNPPTLLFATVDKFAQIAHRPEAHVFFNSKKMDGLPLDLPPDLIIQDELHLLNGPLGSVVGLFETVIELLSSRSDGRKPKIVASTATTRNTAEQIRGLYGADRRVNIFPPSGIEYSDSYFSRIVETDKDGKSASRRRHIGFMPTGKTGVDAQVRAIIPALLMARLEIYRDSLKFAEGDKRKNDWMNYWTIVSYYNSLKDVGKTYNKVADEILTEIKKLHTRHGLRNPLFDFNHNGLLDRTAELTSRIPSNKIKTALKMLESAPVLAKYTDSRGVERLGVRDVTDLVLVSNMFSVGIDIGRLNVMLMNGQPKNIAEYIQASSRVARNTEGVVINLLDANRAREKSYFEHYVPFHQAYYRFVEPLTVTPFTEITFEKALKSLLVIFVRHIQGLNKDKEAHDFQGNITDLVQKIITRIPDSNAEMRGEAEQILSNLTADWRQIIADRSTANDKLTYKNLLGKNVWQLMNSMRETDTSSLIEVQIDSFFIHNLNLTQDDGETSATE